MKLKELLKDITVLAIKGSDDVEVTGVNIDSRRIKEGYLFVAMKGTQVDDTSLYLRLWSSVRRLCSAK